MSTILQDSNVEQLRLQRRGGHTYQIFPGPADQQDCSQVRRMKERLPSIVVEPSEESEEESGELPWPPSSQTSTAEQEDEEEDEDEDAFQNASAQEEQRREDGVLHFKRSSIPGIQIDYSRLTPPPSPTSSHAAPPCFRS